MKTNPIGILGDLLSQKTVTRTQKFTKIFSMIFQRASFFHFKKGCSHYLLIIGALRFYAILVLSGPFQRL